MTQAIAQSALIDNSAIGHAAYDEVPYVSLPFPQTNPLLLQGIAQLFGLNILPPQKARILEIGCASGSNIIAIASKFPGSTCVGIDYSERQIAIGAQQVKEMGLGNLTLKHMSVMDVEPAFGQFDYIICHGVLSWVAAEVQEKIIKVCSANLARDGLAYVSYNTLPGWNVVRSLRDMMMYHTARFPTAAEKASQARLLLKFVGEGMRANNHDMASFVEQEYQRLEKQPDAYLLHDHLEENNTPLYFHEFMSRVSEQGLQYLADVSLGTMFSGNFPPEIAQALASSDDIVRTEQYMDYITNRRFRSTLLCHNDRILNRNLNPEALKNGWLVSHFIYPQEFEKHDIASMEKVSFGTPGGMGLVSTEPVCLAMLQALQEKKISSWRIADIVPNVREKLKGTSYEVKDADMPLLESKICAYLMRYLFIDAIQYFADELPFTLTVADKPKVSKLVRHQAARQNWVTSQRNEPVSLETFDQFLLPYLDGTNDKSALQTKMLTHFGSKQLTMQDNGKPMEDQSVITERLVPIIDMKLQHYAAIALLEK